MAIGGGSGLPVLLRGLKPLVGETVSQLTAVVTVSDDGGSSGRLRRELGVLPPGDIRNCLVALADDEDLLAKLFQYRFANGDGLSGHSFGNLFLTALTGLTGDFYRAILTAERILSVRGKILPATLSDVRLDGVGLSGSRYEGESAVGRSGEALAQLEFNPSAPAGFPPAVKAIETADLILLGPGSLYTSILPNLLIPDIAAAVRRSSAPVTLVLNLMTQPGETDEMSGLDHLSALERHAWRGLVDRILVNSTPIPAETLVPYAEVGARTVTWEHETPFAGAVEVVAHDLLAPGSPVRHDGNKLAAAVVGMVTDREGGIGRSRRSAVHE